MYDKLVNNKKTKKNAGKKHSVTAHLTMDVYTRSFACAHHAPCFLFRSMFLNFMWNNYLFISCAPIWIQHVLYFDIDRNKQDNGTWLPTCFEKNLSPMRSIYKNGFCNCSNILIQIQSCLISLKRLFRNERPICL